MRVTLKLWDGEQISDVIISHVKMLIQTDQGIRVIFQDPKAKTITYPKEMFFAAIEEREDINDN